MGGRAWEVGGVDRKTDRGLDEVKNDEDGRRRDETRRDGGDPKISGRGDWECRCGGHRTRIPQAGRTVGRSIDLTARDDEDDDEDDEDDEDS